MGKGRLEAFSDGVLAIILTVMVLELKTPREPNLDALQPMIPALLSYALSFVFIGIYWNNHHHLLQASEKVNGAVLWANMHLLFWLSLIPFVTGWTGQTNFASVPVAVYGVVLLFAAIAFTILVRVLIACHGPDSRLARAVGADFKGNTSLVLYALALPAAFVHPWIACTLYAVVALIWLIPDRRIERVFTTTSQEDVNRLAD
jgi:uncharacterized membrane protein